MSIKVKLRQKEISGNRQSLYLDFYPAIPHPETGEPTRREFLGQYLLSENITDKTGKKKKIKLSPIDKQHNKETLQLAEQIRQKKENHLNKPEIYTGYEKEQLKIKEQGEQNFVSYFKSLADKRKASNYDNWASVTRKASYYSTYLEPKRNNRIELHYNFYFDWLIEIKDNKLRVSISNILFKTDWGDVVVSSNTKTPYDVLFQSKSKAELEGKLAKEYLITNLDDLFLSFHTNLLTKKDQW